MKRYIKSDWQEKVFWDELMDAELQGTSEYSGKDFSNEYINMDRLIISSGRYIKDLADILNEFGMWLEKQPGHYTWGIEVDNSDVRIDIILPSGMEIEDWIIPTYWFLDGKVDFEYLKNSFYRMIS